MEHYPERMGKIFVVGAPAVFKGLWEVLRLLLDSRTKAKVLAYKVLSLCMYVEIYLISVQGNLREWTYERNKAPKA